MSNPRIVTLDNSSLLTLLKNSSVLSRFPALKYAAKKLKAGTKGCGRCGRRGTKARDGAVNDMKRMIGGWSTANKDTLKKLLRADRIRLVVGKKMTEF